MSGTHKKDHVRTSKIMCSPCQSSVDYGDPKTPHIETKNPKQRGMWQKRWVDNWYDDGDDHDDDDDGDGGGGDGAHDDGVAR